MSIKKETCICIIKSVKHLHIKKSLNITINENKIKQCTKVRENTGGGGNFHTSRVRLNVIEGCSNRTCHRRRHLPRCLTRGSTLLPSWPVPAGRGTKHSSRRCCRRPRRQMRVSEASAQESY